MNAWLHLSNLPLWVLACAALTSLAYLGLLLAPETQSSYSRTALLLVCLMHGVLAIYMLSNGRFGFGPALSITAWLALLIYALESRWYPQLALRRPLAVLSGLALLLGLLFPGKSLPAGVSLGLPLHAALGLAAYGLLLMSAVHAWLMHDADQQIREAVMDQHSHALPILTLERLMFAFAYAAFALLCATLLAGAFFGEVLYGKGHAWQWNHKTVLTALAWGVLALLIYGRWQWGWRGKKAARWIYSGSIFLVLSYVGSRFVLEVLLGRTA